MLTQAVLVTLATLAAGQQVGTQLEEVRCSHGRRDGMLTENRRSTPP